MTKVEIAAAEAAAAKAAAAEAEAAKAAEADAAKAAEAAVAASATEPNKVKARILADGPHGRVNQVAEIEQAEAELLQAGGQVDTHPAAVAYAESLIAAAQAQG